VKLSGFTRDFQSKELPLGFWRPANLQPGDRLGLLATFDGRLMLFVNDELTVMIAFANVPWMEKLHAIVDLDGCTKAIRLVNNQGHPPLKVVHHLRRMREEEFKTAERIDLLRVRQAEIVSQEKAESKEKLAAKHREREALLAQQRERERRIYRQQPVRKPSSPKESRQPRRHAS